MKFTSGAVVVAAVALLGFAHAAGAQTSVATMSGEALASCNDVGATVITCDAGSQGSRDFRIRCNADGSGSVTWTASGVATGPYPGLFTETGTAVFGPPSAPAVTQLTVSFHIDSPVGDVDGRKLLASGSPQLFGVCGEGSSVPHGAVVSGVVRYEAIIKPETGGVFGDEGTATLDLIGETLAPLPVGTDVETDIGLFAEFFVSILPEATPLLTTAKDQCKDDGFRQFGVFQNQGDCVAFVETLGKNEPGQNVP
jgi:hypothetical protein